MSQIEIQSEFTKYKVRVIQYLKSRIVDLDEGRVLRIIESNYPDYRIINQKLEFEFI